MTCVLGLDPGFASTGFAVVQLGKTSSEDQIRLMGVVRTQKAATVRKVRASDDNLDRAREIYSDLRRISDQYGVKLICAETMSFPRNSSTAAKMSLCWGVIAALSFQLNIPITQATPQEIKRYVCGDKSASKEQVQQAINGIFPRLAAPDTPFLKNIPKSALEHPYDALAAILACRDSDVMMLARRMGVCVG